MAKLLLFFVAVTVALVNLSSAFHAKIKVRKDGSISADGLQGYANFDKTCIKDDYCTYLLKAPPMSPTDYANDLGVISNDGSLFEGAQSSYNEDTQKYQDFQDSWRNSSGEIEALLRNIEAINKMLPSVLDSIEKSIISANETYLKIGTALTQVGECYRNACSEATSAPVTQQPGQNTGSTDEPPEQNTGSTAEPASTQSPPSTEAFTGSTPSPGPTNAPNTASTTASPDQTTISGGSDVTGGNTATTDGSGGHSTTEEVKSTTESTNEASTSSTA